MVSGEIINIFTSISVIAFNYQRTQKLPEDNEEANRLEEPPLKKE